MCEDLGKERTRFGIFLTNGSTTTDGTQIHQRQRTRLGLNYFFLLEESRLWWETARTFPRSIINLDSPEVSDDPQNEAAFEALPKTSAGSTHYFLEFSYDRYQPMFVNSTFTVTRAANSFSDDFLSSASDRSWLCLLEQAWQRGRSIHCAFSLRRSL